MSGRGPFFQSERNDVQGTGINRLPSQAASSTDGRQKPGHGDLLKTISIGFIADGLIFRIISKLVEIIHVKSIEIYLHNVIIRP